jgi:hypothetical protein
MYRQIIRAGVVALAAAALGLVSTAARAASTTCDYTLATRALTGPEGGDLTVTVTAAGAGCTAPDALKKIQLKTFGLDDSLAATRNLTDVPAPGGVASVDLGPIARGQRIAAEVLVQTEDTTRTDVLRDSTKALLRPDLVVTAVTAPRQALAGHGFDVEVKVAEQNGDVGATATLSLATGTTELGTTAIDVAAGGTETKSFHVTLADPGAVRLDATIANAVPRETNASNDDGHATVEVTEFEVDQSQVLASGIAGYGGQFNGRVYAKISRDAGVTPQNVGDMESKMVALQPQLARIFIAPIDLGDPDRMASFVKTAQLAQQAGSIINITWQGGTFDTKSGNIQKFAAVINDLVKNKGITNLRWLTLQNEPNGGGSSLTPQQYEQRYRTLDPFILDVRGQVKYMGGDLVKSGGTPALDQQVWFDYMATHMSDILDAWSVHIFWDYWDTQKLQDRLNEVRAIWDAEPANGRKPLYVMEYGVRGLRTFNGIGADPGFWQDGTPLTQTNINAFQHAWFDILSARLGYVGTVKWDSYFAKYDNGTQAYYMIGRPQDGWPLFPIYHSIKLWTMSVKPGWSVIGLDGGAGTKLLTAYTGPTGGMTVLGLDTSGAQLNAASTTQVSYSIGGLPPLTTFHVGVWNETGDGKDVVDADVTADPAGVATLSVPLNAVFALTTLPVQAG